MSRTQGAKNIIDLADRTALSTLPREEVGHLPDATGPKDELKYVITNQGNLRSWLKRKDAQLKALAKAAEGGSKKKLRGPRDGTTTKYDWYLSHLLSLELVGGLEFFFKTTMIALADALGSTLDPADFTKAVSAASLVPVTGGVQPSFGEVFYEHQLFHNLGHVNEALKQLVGASWLVQPKPKSDDERLKRGIEIAFQVRHTLAHNRGYVTKSDAAKFRMLNVAVTATAYLDTRRDKLYEALSELVKKALEAFVPWLRVAVTKHLTKAHKADPLALTAARRSELVRIFDTDADFDALPWAP